MKQKVAFLMAAMLILVFADNETVLAGEINEHEASVIAVAGGTFQYQGKTYVAKAEYQSQLQAKLAEDGIDLTAAQASEAISMIYANVETGVQAGYLEEVAGSDDTPDDEENQEIQEGSSGKRRKETNSSAGADEGSGATDTSEEGQDSGDTSEMVISMGEIIASDEEAADYHGYDIQEIYQKEPDERTEEEQQAYEDYVAEKAVEQLHLGESKENSEAAVKIDEGVRSQPDLSWLFPVVILLAGAAAIGVCISWVLRRRKIAANRKKLPKTFVDIHSHVLPGVDDGSPDMETTIQMIEKAYQQGIRCMIATPHYRSDHRHHRVETLLELYEEVCAEIRKHHPDFQLLLGNEIYFTERVLDKLEKGRALPLAQSRYVLVEFSPEDSWQWIQGAVIKLLRERYIPVIAHAERYRYLVQDLERVEELRRMGAWIQVNANGGKPAKKLWRAGCVDLLASDCHDLRHRKPNLQKGLVQLCAYGDDELMKKVLVENPSNIIYTENN